MKMRRALLAILVFAIAEVSLGRTTAERPGRPAETGTIEGHVLDAANRPVAKAVVILCDRTSGMPVNAESFQPFTEAFLTKDARGKTDPYGGILYAVTDTKGAFAFQDVPAGDYRLVAQSWLDAEEVKGLFEKNGKQIALHGIAERVRVASGNVVTAVLRPLGTGTLVIDQHAPNDETLLVLSASPTCADPILGFAGWAGAFMQNVLGGNRMPKGQTTVFGLPEGTVYFAMFAADSVPGWTEGQVEIRQDAPAVLEEIPFVCSWSNGRHQPPENLKALVEEIKAIEEKGLPPEDDHPLMQLGRLSREEKPEGQFGYQQWLSRHLDHEFERPSGGKVLLKDLVAASQYVQLQRRVEEKKEQSKKRSEAMARFRASRDRKEADVEAGPQAPPAIDTASPESYFPDDPAAAQELDELWAVKREALKSVPEDELLEIVRKGLRGTTANRNDIIKTIGSRLVWHKSPSNPHAVDILYAAGFEPGLENDAFYYGLTTAKPKPPYVLDRLVELALDGHEVGRIAWGTQDQTDEFLLRLQSHIKDADDAQLHQTRNIVRVIEAMKSGVYDRGPGEIKLQELRRIRKHYAQSLGQIRQRLLAHGSATRRTELERIRNEKMYLLFDEAFVPALVACGNDENAAVRAQTAELAGLYWLWGESMKHLAITQLLMDLSRDPVREVRFTAVEKGLFNIPDKADKIIKRIIDLTLAEKDDMPEELYPRIGAVLRKNRPSTQKVLLEYLDRAERSRESVMRLYRDALRSDPPAAR